MFELVASEIMSLNGWKHAGRLSKKKRREDSAAAAAVGIVEKTTSTTVVGKHVLLQGRIVSACAIRKDRHLLRVLVTNCGGTDCVVALEGVECEILLDGGTSVSVAALLAVKGGRKLLCPGASVEARVTMTSDAGDSDGASGGDCGGSTVSTTQQTCIASSVRLVGVCPDPTIVGKCLLLSLHDIRTVFCSTTNATDEDEPTAAGDETTNASGQTTAAEAATTTIAEAATTTSPRAPSDKEEEVGEAAAEIAGACYVSLTSALSPCTTSRLLGLRRHLAALPTASFFREKEVRGCRRRRYSSFLSKSSVYVY